MSDSIKIGDKVMWRSRFTRKKNPGYDYLKRERMIVVGRNRGLDFPFKLRVLNGRDRAVEKVAKSNELRKID